MVNFLPGWKIAFTRCTLHTFLGRSIGCSPRYAAPPSPQRTRHPLLRKQAHSYVYFERQSIASGERKQWLFPEVHLTCAPDSGLIAYRRGRKSCNCDVGQKSAPKSREPHRRGATGPEVCQGPRLVLTTLIRTLSLRCSSGGEIERIGKIDSSIDSSKAPFIAHSS